MTCGAREAANKLNVDLLVDGPTEYSPIPQITILNALLTKQPDVVVITPTDKNVLVAPMLAAKEAGAKLIETDSFIEDASISSSRIGADGYEGGSKMADALAESLGGKGKVLMIGLVPGIQTLDDREKAFADRLKEKHPNIEYVGREYSGDSTEKVAAIINATLLKHPDLAGVVSSALLPSEAAAATIRNNGLSGKVKVMGFDATPAEVAALRDGSMTALIAQTPRAYGRLAIEQAVALTKGEAVPARTKTDWVVLTKENIDAPEHADALNLPTCDVK
jgi:ribose transport system substrate-binding protein